MYLHLNVVSHFRRIHIFIPIFIFLNHPLPKWPIGVLERQITWENSCFGMKFVSHANRRYRERAISFFASFLLYSLDTYIPIYYMYYFFFLPPVRTTRYTIFVFIRLYSSCSQHARKHLALPNFNMGRRQNGGWVTIFLIPSQRLYTSFPNPSANNAECVSPWIYICMLAFGRKRNFSNKLSYHVLKLFYVRHRRKV